MAPRLPRVVIAHTPHHVVQRGHSRQAIFTAPEDYKAYLSDLKEKSAELNVRVYAYCLYAYCLMTNHVHLLLMPSDDVLALAKLMQEVGRRATRRWNERWNRSGTLWESRYKSNVVQTEAYLLACCRYIELNPVRAHMAAQAAEYPWSSYKARMGMAEDGLLELHPVYQALGFSAEERRAVYQNYVESAAPTDEIERIRSATQSGNPLASEEYSARLEGILHRQVVTRRRGRPAKM